ncbi:transglycosylase domain-containing protein, partial [Dialister invisus]
EKNWLEELTSRIGTLITTPAVEEGKSNPSLSPDTEDSKKDSSLSTVKEKLGNILHFKESLEARVDRNKFISQKEIPDLLKKGIIATEDRRFYEHGAIDPIGVTRAAVTNYFAGRTLEGGSTITQQTVKNIFLSNDRTILRKMEELALAVQLEKYYTKDQILELYLNTIYFGHGAYGLKEASLTYFGKEPKDLDLSQCAMLAGLPQAPSAYDPIDHPKEGAQRMTVVLTLMAQQGYISPEDAAKAAMNLWLK